MQSSNTLDKVQAELAAGMQLAKCHKCGCMQDMLTAMAATIPTLDAADGQAMAAQVEAWLSSMEPVQYSCLGCSICYPAEAQSALVDAFPLADVAPDLHCGFRTVAENWPPVVGEYRVLDRSAPVAVSTLASTQLVEILAEDKPSGLAIVGKTETENIGIDKVIKNVVANPAIRFLIVAGVESYGHQSGSALLALAEHGVDAQGRIIGSAAKRPILRNVSPEEIDAFRRQVRVIDLRGCEDAHHIAYQVEVLAAEAVPSCGCGGTCSDETLLSDVQWILPPPAHEVSNNCADTSCGCTQVPAVAVAVTSGPETGKDVRLDKAGYFVILPLEERQVINVEHYTYDHSLRHTIEGTDARSLYLAIITEQWVTELSHAAYLGKELAKAELSLRYGFKYVQDGA